MGLKGSYGHCHNVCTRSYRYFVAYCTGNISQVVVSYQKYVLFFQYLFKNTGIYYKGTGTWMIENDKVT